MAVLNPWILILGVGLQGRNSDMTLSYERLDS